MMTGQRPPGVFVAVSHPSRAESEPRIVGDLTAAGPGPFVLLAGAGSRIWQPSSLPTWTEFNKALLDEATARARRALP